MPAEEASHGSRARAADPPAQGHPDEPDGVSASPSPANHHTARKRRPRKTDREQPQLQFVTATDPGQFRDQSARRHVRSHAMVQYRYRSGLQNSKSKQVDGEGKENDRFSVKAASKSSVATYIADLEPFSQPCLPLRVALHDSARSYAALPHSNASSATEQQLQKAAASSEVSEQDLTEQKHWAFLHAVASRLSYSADQSLNPFSVLPQFSSQKASIAVFLRNCKNTSERLRLTRLADLLHQACDGWQPPTQSRPGS